MYLGALEGHCKESTCLVISSLPCPIDTSKKVISANLLLWARLLIQIHLDN